jgi:hypothetical protein
MRTEAEKAAEELLVFDKFVRLSVLKVVAGTAQKRLPPEPDILCEIEPHSPIAFELAEACAPEFAVAEARALREGIAVAWGSDVSEETVRKKLKKTYPVRWPVELLLYIDGRTATQDQILQAMIVPILSAGLGQFRRVWFMGESVIQLASVQS